MGEYNIEKYNIWIKILVLIYIGWKATSEGVSLIYIVIFLLVNIILTLSYFLVKKRLTKIVLGISILINLWFVVYSLPYAAFIYSINVLEFSCDKNQLKVGKFIVLAIPVFIIRDKYFMGYYIISSAIIYQFLSLYTEALFLLNKLDSDVEDKRKEIYSLNIRLRHEEEYRNQALNNVKLKERNELSQKMHDKVGHTIAGALMQLEAVKIIINKNNDKSMEMLDNTIKVLRLGMDDIRKTLREIKPSKEELGVNKIKTMIDEKIKNTKYEFMLTHTGDLDKIEYEQWVLITDAVRELTTNSIKYSKGYKICVKIEVFNKLIKIETKDNGKGTNIIEKGIGLSSIEQKVADLCGKLLIDGNDGFSVVILLPIIERGN